MDEKKAATLIPTFLGCGVAIGAATHHLALGIAIGGAVGIVLAGVARQSARQSEKEKQ